MNGWCLMEAPLPWMTQVERWKNDRLPVLIHDGLSSYLHSLLLKVPDLFKNEGLLPYLV